MNTKYKHVHEALYTLVVLQQRESYEVKIITIGDTDM